MRVVIATPLYPPEIGGPATYSRLLEKGLSAHGIEVVLVKFSDVRRLPKIIRHYAYYRRVLKAARDADAVLALDPVSVGLPAMIAAQKVRKPFVVKIVGDYAWEQGQQRFGVTERLDAFVQNSNVPLAVRILRKIQTRVARSATRVIVPSSYLRDIVTSWGILENKIQVIYNAVSINKIGVVPDVVAKLPRPLVVTVARLVSWKGIDELLRVFDRIWTARGGGPNSSLVIIGTGPEEQKLKTQAEKLSIRDNCVFTGDLSHEQTLAVIQEADIFILNSSYEGLSHVLIEALRLGTCILATSVGGNQEIIAPGDGKLITAGSETELASSLKMLIENKDKRDAYASAAKQSGERFSPEVMISATAAFLKKL